MHGEIMFEPKPDGMFVGIPIDQLASPTSGRFSITLVFGVPSYFEDNLLALRHWKLPGS